MKKIFIIFFAVVLLCGCTAQQTIAVTQPAATAAGIYSPGATVASTLEKTQEKTPSPSSESSATAYPPLSEAETAAGLTPEIKGYIYGWDSLSRLEGYDLISYVKAFDDQTKDFDLNGDGIKDDIRLEAKDMASKEGQDTNYNKLSVHINGQVLTLQADPGYFFQNDDDGIPGEVVDIDKNDNKKELLAIMYPTETNYTLNYIIKYDNNTPEIIGKVKCNFINPKYINGTGFMVAYDNIGNTNVLKIVKLNEDRTGFIEIPLPLYKTAYTSYEGKTKTDVLLAAKPGGASDIELKKGTKVTVGYYDSKDYIEIRTSAGTLGWLNLEGKGMEYLDKLFGDNIGKT